MIAAGTRKPLLRTLLVLGRVSNLPTVWSNCLCGFLLAAGGDWVRFGLVCAGATFLYLGGMFLNDAFDAQFDQQRRRERPIPSGAISSKAVWQWGLAWMLLGCATLGVLGKVPALITAMLATLILIYDAIHKIFAFSPVMMATCRLLLILLAASVGAEGITGLAMWSAMALGAYTFGLTALARNESNRGNVPYWPCVFLGVPVFLAIVVNPGDYFGRTLLLSIILLLWLWRCLRIAYWSAHTNIVRSVAGLLAGMILVDLLAVGPDLSNPIIPFFSLFALALLLQRFVPAS